MLPHGSHKFRVSHSQIGTLRLNAVWGPWSLRTAPQYVWSADRRPLGFLWPAMGTLRSASTSLIVLRIDCSYSTKMLYVLFSPHAAFVST